MIKSRSSTFTKVHSIMRVCLMFVLMVASGFGARAAISATITPTQLSYEYCSTVADQTQSFTVTATTNCSNNPTALDYLWIIKRSGGTIDTLTTSGTYYNSGTTNALQVTDVAALFGNGDSLFC